MDEEDDVPNLSPLLRTLSLEARAGNIPLEARGQIQGMLLSGNPDAVRHAAALLPQPRPDPFSGDFLGSTGWVAPPEAKETEIFVEDEDLDLQQALSDSVTEGRVNSSPSQPDEWGPSMGRQVSFEERMPPVEELLRQVSNEARSGAISLQTKAELKEKLLSRNPDHVRAAAKLLTQSTNPSLLRSRTPESFFDFLARDELFNTPGSEALEDVGFGDYIFDEAFDFQRALSNSFKGQADTQATPQDESAEFQAALANSLSGGGPSSLPLPPPPVAMMLLHNSAPLPSLLPPPEPLNPPLPPPPSLLMPFGQLSWPGNTEDDYKAPADYFNSLDDYKAPAEYFNNFDVHVHDHRSYATDFRHPEPVSQSRQRVVPFQPMHSSGRVSRSCRPYAASHMASETDLVIPKYVVSMWGPVRDGQREYSEVRVCTGEGRSGKEINLYNSIDLCVGAGMTNSQARVNLTKWRKKHPEMIGVRAKMDGSATHQSPYCVPIEGVRSILEQFQKTECLQYFFEGTKERLSSSSPPCLWPSAWWEDQMNQTRLRRMAKETLKKEDPEG